MRIFLLFLLLSSPILAAADGFAGASGNNSLGQTISIVEEMSGDEINDPSKWGKIDVSDTSKPGHSSRFLFSKECTFTTEQATSFLRCRNDGESPLAGATYKVTISTKRKNACGKFYKIYLCISGCDEKRVPKIFYEDPWEC